MENETKNLKHVPVMMEEVLTLLNPFPGQNFLDCTLGGGGHTAAILEKSAPSGKVYGIDRDLYAISKAKDRLKEFGNRVEYVHGKFSDVANLIPSAVWPTLQGALIDCGVSSFQLDSEERGFSFRFDSPLDMRMNPNDPMSAKEFLHQTREEEIADTIYQLGEERNSRKIAKNIVMARSQHKLNTTFDLVEVVMKSFPPRYYYKTHPATKTFQAIRMKINGEIEEIQTGLAALMSKLPSQAKIVVITFHSLEDRLVKYIFRQAHAAKTVKLLVKKPLQATREESHENLRSRSAKVRSVELI